MRIALALEYDGTGFAGWQTQAAGTGVQDAVEQAIAAIAGHPVATVCAGRTDAGVHATLQVTHFDTSAARPLTAWVRGVNAHLPDSIAVLSAHEVADDFHARFSARSRSYAYWLINSPTRPALLAHRLGWVFQPLDVEAMRAAAAPLVGTHDFSAYRSAECQAKSPIRTVQALQVHASGAHLRVQIEANAFLHHMVRNIVGALVDVGLGRRDADWTAELLRARDRRRGSATFPAAGLYLTSVRYDGDSGIPVAPRDPWPAPL